MKKKIPIRYIFILYILTASFLLSGSGNAASDDSSHPYAGDDRLEFLRHKVYPYDIKESPGGFYLIDDNQYFYSCAITYTEEEIASFSHAQFDEQGRLIYMLGYSPNVMKEDNCYCEENIYEWDNEEHTCRYIYYKANSRLQDSCFYIAYRQMFKICYYRFREDGRLLSFLMYYPIIDAAPPVYYSDELYFDRGYQAEFDSDRLITELLCYDYWGTNESGSWEHRIYQYDETDRCILKVVTADYDITIQRFEYDDAAGKTHEYIYHVKEDWELTLDNGTTYYFYYHGSDPRPMIQKVSSDGTIKQELFYARTCDLGQQHYLIPDEIETTVKVHRYVVQPGDCLWKIARNYYGYGSYSNILYRANRNLIGYDPDMITPGLCLYLPEIGNAENTVTSFF